MQPQALLNDSPSITVSEFSIHLTLVFSNMLSGYRMHTVFSLSVGGRHHSVGFFFPPFIFLLGNQKKSCYSSYWKYDGLMAMSLFSLTSFNMFSLFLFFSCITMRCLGLFVSLAKILCQFWEILFNYSFCLRILSFCGSYDMCT